MHGLGEGLGATARQCPAPDLDDEVVEVGPAAGQVGHHLVPDRLATLYGQAVLVALARKGQCPGVDLLAQPDVGGVAGHARRAGAHDHIGPQVAEAVDDPGVGVDRYEHAQAPATGGRDHGRGQGGVAATGDGQIGPVARTGQPQAFGHLEVQEHTHQVPRLVRAGDVAGLVLDPHPAATLKAQALGEVLAALEGRGPKTNAVHGGDGTVEALDQGQELLVRHPARHGAVVAVQEGPVPGERLGPRPVPRREAHPGRVEGPDQDVVNVTLTGPGAAEGVRLVNLW